MSTERPILFSGPMVRAILDGRKTQTRRVVKPSGDQRWLSPELLQAGENARVAWADGALGAQFDHPQGGPLTWVRCPYGTPGDRLWVRETWSHGGDGVWSIADARVRGRGGVLYQADDKHPHAKWWPSIHMPREFSRITLEITGVRVERLQDCSEADAVAEGAARLAMDDEGRFYEHASGSHRLGYAGLWEHINGPGSWAANPWVWVVEFQRVAQG